MIHPPLVLISGHNPLESVGGHQSYVHAYSLAVARLGFEPHIFCIGRHTRTTIAEFGVVHQVASRGIRLTQQPLVARAVVRFLSGRPGPHVIQGFSIWAAAAVLAKRWLRRRGIEAKAVASAYGTRAYEVRAMQDGLEHHSLAHRIRYALWLWWIRLADDHLEGWAYAKSDIVLINYESVRNILTRAYGGALPIRKIPYTTVDAFLDADDSASGPTAKLIVPLPRVDAPLILAISRHDPRKGVDVLLLALAEIGTSGLPFRACLIGPGRLLDAHRALASRLGLDDRVSLLGRVPDVRPYLAEADIFVLPSLAEASGSVSVIEALRSGIAVVASACDGIPEDLTNLENALLVRPGDCQSLAVALRTLLLDADLRKRLGAAGRRTYEEHFSAAGLVAALRGVYSDLGVSAPVGVRLHGVGDTSNKVGGNTLLTTS